MGLGSIVVMRSLSVHLYRRGWDSNPRGSRTPHPISSRRRYDRFGTSPGAVIILSMV